MSSIALVLSLSMIVKEAMLVECNLRVICLYCKWSHEINQGANINLQVGQQRICTLRQKKSGILYIRIITTLWIF